MRLLPMLLALPLLTLQAHAQSAPTQQIAPATSAAAPTAAAPATAPHHRLSWQQHFAQANVAHDGHLTLEEAKGGYPTVARHFQEIDADKKGYVTEEDLTNWHKLQRAMHHSTLPRAGDGLRPRPAIQRGATMSQPISTSTEDKLLPMTQSGAPTEQK